MCFIYEKSVPFICCITAEQCPDAYTFPKNIRNLTFEIFILFDIIKKIKYLSIMIISKY